MTAIVKGDEAAHPADISPLGLQAQMTNAHALARHLEESRPIAHRRLIPTAEQSLIIRGVPRESDTCGWGEGDICQLRPDTLAITLPVPIYHLSHIY